MEHVRHRVKREVDAKIDAKFPCITAMETHIRQLIKILNPRKNYNELLLYFREIVEHQDYSAMLKVFNHKTLMAECDVANLLGYKNRDDYVRGVISLLKTGSEEAENIRKAIRNTLIPNE